MAKKSLILFVTGIFFLIVGFFSVQENKEVIYHNSYFNTPTISDNAFNQVGVVDSSKGIVGLLVNHHLLAPHLIAEAFVVAQEEDIDTVILIAPNHFNTGLGKRIVSQAYWRTPYGVLEPELLSKKIIDTLDISIEEYPFEKEHGISGIIPFIKRTFPKARVLPIILKDSYSLQDATNLGRQFAKMYPNKTLLVGSFDFAHGVSQNQAIELDSISIPIIENFKHAEVSSVSVDSKPGIAFMLGYMEEKQARFSLIQNTNAALLLNQPNLSDVTSYIVGYFYK